MHGDLILIGKLGRPHGLQGELKAAVEPRYEDDFLEAKAVFLDIKGRPIPHFISYVRGGGALIVKLEEIDDLNAARSLQGIDLLLREADLKYAQPSEAERWAEVYADLAGYQIHDLTLGAVGTIAEVLEMPQQWVAQLDDPVRTLYVPLHPHLIRSIDEVQRILYMDLPEGLLD